MFRDSRYAICGIVAASWLLSGNDAPSSISAQDAQFFETRIRPVLAKNCYGCHGPDQQLSSLRIDSREAMLKGGKRGASIIPGDPENSLLVQSIRHQSLRMPMGGKLKDAEIAGFEQWIRRGAPWPAASRDAVSSRADTYVRLAREHWAFRPVQKIEPPSISEQASSENPIDRFVLDALRRRGLQPSRLADKRVLLRRLSYVLTGLPPSAEQSDRFVENRSPDAYEQEVDRLLASPHFGEQWARHWLDLVRFGETRGYEWNYEIIGAWRYRDYLIRAFNADVPYDQLVREHIAGDLLDNPRLNVQEQINESVIGTAFYRLGEAGHDDCIKFREIALDVADNEIDTLTKTFQALTVSCSRCHDHKLDPIPTEDYYALYSILNSSRVVTHTIDLPQVNADAKRRLRALKAGVRAELASIWTREVRDAEKYMLAAQHSPHLSHVVTLDRARVDAWTKALHFRARGLEHPAYVWSSLACATGGNERFLPEQATALSERYRREAPARESFNRKNFESFGDFTDASNAWFASGNAVGDAVVSAPDFAIAPAGDSVIETVLPRGFYTHVLSSRLNGAIRSPDLPKNREFISLRIMGGNLGARRTVIDNCAIGENYKVLESDTPRWVKLETFADQQRLPVFVELVTRSDNPRIPDRPEVLKPHQLELLDSPRSYFGITAAMMHDIPEGPRETLGHMLPLFEAGAPSTWSAMAARYGRRIRAAVGNWSSGRATEDDVRWLNWLLENRLLSNDAGVSPKLRNLIVEYRAIEAQIPAPRVVEGLADTGHGRDFPVLVGGDPKNFGQTPRRHFLNYIIEDKPIQTGGSGRRELAELIASPSNPLTARVMVNRIWHHVFGRGIVASVDNFGLLGENPSHPELLDYLAARFVEEGWAVKKMIRLMVLSQTFRQSGEMTSRAREIDPQNAMLHHYRLRRLEAESIRDSVLFASGKLRESMFGPSTDPYRDQAKDYRRLFSGPLDGDARRSIYLKVTRMEGSRFLETFDYPSAMATRGSRDVTNVPAQALTLMNDPFIVGEAEACATRLLASPAASVDARVEKLFRITLARPPDASELERFRGLAAEIASLHKVPRESLLNSAAVWKDLAHTIFNMKEFVYIQ